MSSNSSTSEMTLQYSEQAFRELYEALKQLSKWCDDNLNGVPTELGRIQELADAAIGKAERK